METTSQRRLKVWPQGIRIVDDQRSVMKVTGSRSRNKKIRYNVDIARSMAILGESVYSVHIRTMMVPLIRQWWPIILMKVTMDIF